MYYWHPLLSRTRMNRTLHKPRSLMKLQIYHLKNCDRCHKAITALEQADHEIHLIDVRANGLSRKDWQYLLEKAGMDALINRKSTTWRNLAAEQKNHLTVAKALALLQAYPTLMKRPVIMKAAQDDKPITIGWTKDIEIHYNGS